MFGLKSGGAAYQEVGLETKVLSASPKELISLLYMEAEKSILIAKGAALSGDIALKHHHVERASNIITQGLMDALDMSVGLLAERLMSIYSYVLKRLLWGELKNDPAAFDEAHGLMKTISEAWDSMPEAK